MSIITIVLLSALCLSLAYICTLLGRLDYQAKLISEAVRRIENKEGF